MSSAMERLVANIPARVMAELVKVVFEEEGMVKVNEAYKEYRKITDKRREKRGER